MGMIVDHPIVFGGDPDLFGVLTLPDVEQRRRQGVVICAPFGHPNICSYRPLRTLARRIGEQGWPVLRFDWPGTGDSGDAEMNGEPWTSVWTRAVGQAVAAVRSRTEVDEITLVGLRIGATLALVAAEANPVVTGIGLLAPYGNGRAYLREARAFEALAAHLFSEPEIAPPPLPEGSVESSGFLISPDETAALQSIDLSTRELSSFASRRVLIVTPQPDPNTDRLADRLVEAGASVRTEVTAELVHAWDGTATSVMTRSTSGIVCRWLADTAEPAAAARHPDPGNPVRTVLDAGGCRERPVGLDTPRGRLIGVLCEPNEAARRDGHWVVFLNSGKVRRVGPNRFVTKYARAWARLGVPSFRLDLGGIGDSDGPQLGDERALEGDDWVRWPSYLADVAEALQWLATEHGAKRFELVGLCSGATWGFQAAMVDERVAGVTLLNPAPLYEDRREKPLQAWAQVRRIVRHPSMVRTLRGHGLSELPLPSLRGMLLALTGRGDPGWQRGLILDALEQLRARGVRLLIVFSAGDKTIGCLERPLGPDYASVLGRYGMSVEVVRGPDHTFRPLWSHRLLQEAIERHLGDISFLDPGEARRPDGD